jgi:F0F1-type ATP synthase beta subunit
MAKRPDVRSPLAIGADDYSSLAATVCGPITIPAGDAVLGRLLDVTGNVRDSGPPLPENMPRSPIHRTAPALTDRSPSTAMFETGIKVIGRPHQHRVEA